MKKQFRISPKNFDPFFLDTCDKETESHCNGFSPKDKAKGVGKQRHHKILAKEANQRTNWFLDSFSDHF